MRSLIILLFASAISTFGQAPSGLVISQVFGGGGNAGAPFRNDFIELFNRGKEPVSLDGWSVQYASSTGADWQVTPISGIVSPGRYFLIQQAIGANTAAPALPEPDATGTIAMSATAAKVALIRNTTPSTGATPDDAADLVIYSSLTNTTAAIRRANGCGDDFQTAAPRPRNSGSETQSCDTAPPEATPMRISEIQGPGPESPATGRLVVTHGIVTGRKTNGFFLQSTPEDDDRDSRSSEGIFVFTSSAPPAAAARGNLVEVIGTVAEFRPAADPASAPLTELIEPTVTLIGTNQRLPDPVQIGFVSDLETLEGMRVSVLSLRVVGPTGGTLTEPTATGTSNGVFYAIEEPGVRPFTSPAGILGSRLIRVDSRTLGLQALDTRAGDTTGTVTGLLDFGFNTYTIDTESSILTLSNTQQPGIIPRVAGEFAVAGMNLLRLFDDRDDPGTSDPVLTPTALQTRLVRAGRVIRESLGSPEIIGVEEVENLAVLQALAREAGAYDAFLQEGNDIGGIDVGVLVRRDRVTVRSFSQEGKDTLLDGDILNDRPPVILRAEIDGLPLVVVVNHLRSLINADSPVVARKRRTQAEFLSAILSRESSANVISLGDYNMDQFDPLMQVIRSPGYLNLNDTLRPSEAYTYVFDGVVQALDHILLSRSMVQYLTRYQVAHLNANQPLTAANRASDHDFPVAYFSAIPPTLRAAAVVNAANFTSGSIGPGEWVTSFMSGPVASISVGGQSAAIQSSTAQQTTFVIPSVASAGSTVEIVAGDLKTSTTIANAAPGIFTISGTGRGQGAILNQDTTVNGPENAASRGSIISIYGTGIPGPNTAVWIGTTRADVLYSGVAPGLPAGIAQINARIPAEAPAGSTVPIIVTSVDQASAAGVTMAIR